MKFVEIKAENGEESFYTGTITRETYPSRVELKNLLTNYHVCSGIFIISCIEMNKEDFEAYTKDDHKGGQ